MIALDEILYNALVADSDLMQIVGGRIKDVCFEVGLDGQDNVPLPSIVVIDSGSQEQPETKDCEWLPTEDSVQAGIEVSAESPAKVRQLIRRCRKAVAQYIAAMEEREEDTPYLNSLQRDGVAWDWMKPCYFDTLRYQCTIQINERNEQDY